MGDLMKNTKEINAIVTAIHCINAVSEHRDPDIMKLTDYFFRRVFGCNTNLKTVFCVGQTKETIMPVLMQFLDEETEYRKYLNEYYEEKGDKNNEH